LSPFSFLLIRRPLALLLTRCFLAQQKPENDTDDNCLPYSSLAASDTRTKCLVFLQSTCCQRGRHLKFRSCYPLQGVMALLRNFEQQMKLRAKEERPMTSLGIVPLSDSVSLCNCWHHPRLGGISPSYWFFIISKRSNWVMYPRENKIVPEILLPHSKR